MRGIVETYSSRAEWLAARGGDRIGASEVAAVLGISPWQSAWDLWERKMGRREEPQTEEQARGQLWEPIVLRLYEQQTGATCLVTGPDEFELVRHPDHPWAVQTPDALVEMPGGLGQVEAKTSTQPAEWGEACTITPGWDDAWPLPLGYVVQAYWQLEVAGVEWVDVAALLPYFEMRVYRVLPDPALQGQILTQVGAWRQRHLIGGEPPEADDSAACGRYIRSLARKGERPALWEEEALALELDRARARHKLEGRTVRRLANELGMSAGGATLRLRSGRRIIPRPPVVKAEQPDAWEGVADDDFAALHVGPGSTT